MGEWREDILGEGFVCRDIDLGADAEGPLVATLVRALPEPMSLWDRLLGRRRLLEGVDVLYVHGWSDYFFQKDMARFFTARGARFFALDLRKYGRSLRDGQTPGYVEQLTDYDAEIDRAIAIIAGAEVGASAETASAPAPAAASQSSRRRLILLGHSTGGLTLSLWADRHPGIADALLLNSPWLEFQLAGSGRQLLTPLVKLGARWNPFEVAPQLDYGFYTRAQREVGPRSELEGVNEEWRPERTHAVVAGWLRAILAGHAQVQAGLGIEVPVCVLLSARFALPVRWGEELTSADTVLDVDEIAKAALRLGSSVTVERIDGALHDVFLSAETPRADAYRRTERWLLGLVARWAAEERTVGPASGDRLSVWT